MMTLGLDDNYYTWIILVIVKHLGQIGRADEPIEYFSRRLGFRMHVVSAIEQARHEKDSHGQIMAVA